MTKEMQTLALAPVGNLESYIRAANTWPMLTAEEEKELAEKLHYQGDLEAAKTLILSHLRFVVHVARNYAGYGLPQADLIQEGNIGLMKAVRRFNPEVGVRLVSFAVHWIKAEIHEYVLRNWRIVKVATTKAQRKMFFYIRKKKKTALNGLFSFHLYFLASTCVKPSSVWAGSIRMKWKWWRASWAFPAKTSARWNPVWPLRT